MAAVAVVALAPLGAATVVVGVATPASALAPCRPVTGMTPAIALTPTARPALTRLGLV